MAIKPLKGIELVVSSPLAVVFRKEYGWSKDHRWRRAFCVRASYENYNYYGGSIFFNKKKIRSDEVAEILVKEGIFKDLQADMDKSVKSYSIEKLTDKQLEELLIFHMFVCTKSLSVSFKNDESARSILDKFHEIIYNELLLLPFKIENFYKFQDTQHLRYAEYYKCFDQGSDALRAVGETLSENLLGRKSLTVGISAAAEFISRKEFTDSIKKDFKIITVR